MRLLEDISRKVRWCGNRNRQTRMAPVNTVARLRERGKGGLMMVAPGEEELRRVSPECGNPELPSTSKIIRSVREKLSSEKGDDPVDQSDTAVPF